MKNQKGITLIALVITIIVLLILAGVTISLTVGKNGALQRARTAVSANDIASAAEEVNIAASDAQMQFYDAWNKNQNTKSINYYAATGDGNAYAANCTKAKAIGIGKEVVENVQHVYIKYITQSDVAIYFDMVVNDDDTSTISEGYSVKDSDDTKAAMAQQLETKTYDIAKGTTLEISDGTTDTTK